MAPNSSIRQNKKSYNSVHSAVQKVSNQPATVKAAFQKLGGIIPVAKALFAAVNSAVTITLGQALQWVENYLGNSFMFMIGFFALAIGSGEKNALKMALEELT